MPDVADHTPPLTSVSEDERLLRANVRAFAEAEVAPLSREMDDRAEMPRALIDKLFELGIMGIEIPETHGGAGRAFLHVGDCRGGTVPRRSLGGCRRRRAEHPGRERG